MRNVRRLSPVSVNVCRLANIHSGAERFFIGALNAQHRPANNLSPRSYPQHIHSFNIENLRDPTATCCAQIHRLLQARTEKAAERTRRLRTGPAA
jgi:hypothetical protein